MSFFSLTNSYIQRLVEFLKYVEIIVETFLGKDAPVEDSTGKLIEEFVPETTKETTSLLSKAFNWKEKPEKDAEYNLTENVAIPSHEDIENDSLTNLHEYEQGLKPLAPTAADLSGYSDSEDCNKDEKLRQISETKESLDLEQELGRSLTEEVGELGQAAASSAAEASEGEI